ncbi:MAG: hypothetical protein H7096_02545 [Flavobacterium sp.]|nr:hypothetical protein [Pedobacter sp.]
METLNTMTWESFKNQLLQNPELDLQFQYAENKWVDAGYHITEIKQAPIVSVDCGGVMNRWTEVIVQLWEPGQKQQKTAMKVGKALSIVNLVNRALPIDSEALVKIEFGNPQFDTRQMFPSEIIREGKNLIVDLRPDRTQCKAINRGGSCVTNANGEECCEAVTAKNKLTEVTKNLDEVACCTPGSGCC